MEAHADPSLYPTNTRERTRAINQAIRAEEQRVRARYPWLKYQDFLGTSIFVASLAAMALIAYLYLQGHLVWWLATPLMGLAISILHELEHDLMHNLFFRDRRWIQDFMFCVTWAAKLSMSPWARRKTHLNHHKESGQKEDIEERMIGMGTRNVFLRVMCAIVPLTGSLLFKEMKRDVPTFKPYRVLAGTIPVLLFFDIVMVLALVYVLTGWLNPSDPFAVLPEWGWPWIRNIAVLWTVPNYLRQGSLVLISSYSHYYEDIPRNDVFYQNQILSHWLVFPLNLFVFNFGKTHIIHHYVVDQPFYLRQMVSKAALEEIKRQGARVNDFGVITRANRWGPLREAAPLHETTPA